MFRVGKIKQVTNEKVKIEVVDFEKEKSLNFYIDSDEYAFSFSMRRSLKDLLDIPMQQEIDFKDYIFTGDMFDDKITKKSFIDTNMDIKIYRYVDNSFEINIIFREELNSKEEYSGIIYFDFDLDDYLDKE